ncbi:iron complex outermembrane recepter protein [Saccharicrinis carchari]|uniref:Iron complex outermembrane recepter protein n=1 Tax=Saccharicrinis carchari TaxID=1168039 RepID=A0A521BFN7_SACCC|nr:TonB-dependent receptor [Saccharicrinis carchari]SMO45918.1 iron complex outermembrane recepter protein [Saccharicrinis carchari]
MLQKKYIIVFLFGLIALSGAAQQSPKNIDLITREEVLEMSMDDLLSYDLADVIKLMELVGASSMEDLYELLLNKDVTSASKSAESVFDSPLSTTVLTYDEINASGATSIEEALRLVPGVIVREKTNGNYDVHIRGGQNMPMNNVLLYAENTTTLVMIDGRPVFNYGMGGILWETLPVSLGELDRIEVVRGPSSALYGPNAVNGVINLITKDITQDTPLVSANFQGGTQSTYIGDFSISKKLNDKISAGFSTSYEQRDRNTDEVYALYDDKFLSLADYQQRRIAEGWSSEDIYEMIEEPNRAKEKMGVNAYIYFAANTKLNFNLSGGYLESEAMTSTIGDTPTPYNVRNAQGYFINLAGKIYGFNLQASLNNIEQDLSKGIKGWKQDTEQYNVHLDYLFKWDKFSFRPGLSYQSVYYDDREHIDFIGQGFVNGREALRNYAVSGRLDYNPTEKIRLVAALRAEKYEVPDKIIPSYQFISSYKINENNLLRAVYSRANQSTFVVDAYSSYIWSSEGLSSPEYIHFMGNPDPSMMTMDMLEIGFRTRPTRKILIDIEAFYNKAKDYSALMPDSMRTVVYSDPTTIAPVTSVYESYRPLDLKSKQYGLSISADMVLSEKLILKAHMTYQKSTVDNFQDANMFDIANRQGNAYIPGMTDDIMQYITYVQSGGTMGSNIPPQPSYSSAIQPDPSTFKDDVDNEAIPSFWGSVALTYKPTAKLSVNAQAYYYDKYNLYTMYDAQESRLALGNLNYTGSMEAKFLLNAKVSYKVNDKVNLFVNGRNILNNDKQEYIFMDNIGSLYFAGFNVSF